MLLYLFHQFCQFCVIRDLQFIQFIVEFVGSYSAVMYQLLKLGIKIWRPTLFSFLFTDIFILFQCYTRILEKIMISWHRSLYLGQMISCCFSKCWLIPFKCLLAANISILICVYPMKSYGCLEMYNLEIMTPTNFILRQLALNAMNFDFRYLSYLNATMSILFSIYPSIWVT